MADINLIFDASSISTASKTKDGFIVFDAVLARTGIQNYDKSTLLNFDGEGEVAVYRPDKEVFAQDSLDALKAVPLTLNHPPEMVNLDNIKKYQVGHVVGEPVRDGNVIKSKLVVTDKAAIAAIESGVKDISVGYYSRVIKKDGVTKDGEKYEAVQSDIIPNHIAIVDEGRCGICAIKDSKEICESCKQGNVLCTACKDVKSPENESENMPKLVISDTEHQVDDAVKEAFDEMTKKVKRLEDELAAQKDEKGDLKKEAKQDSEKMKKEFNDTLDSKVEEKLQAVEIARKIIGVYDHKGKSLENIKRDVIKSRNKNVVLDSKSSDYINARFDLIVESLESESDNQVDKFVDSAIENTASPASFVEHKGRLEMMRGGN